MAPSFTRALLALGLASLTLSAAVNSAEPNSENALMQMVPSCNLFYTVQNGDTCWDIISRNDNSFTIKQFLCWNPDVNPWCSNLIPGRNVCIGVNNPGPTC